MPLFYYSDPPRTISKSRRFSNRWRHVQSINNRMQVSRIFAKVLLLHEFYFSGLPSFHLIFFYFCAHIEMNSLVFSRHYQLSREMLQKKCSCKIRQKHRKPITTFTPKIEFFLKASTYVLRLLTISSNRLSTLPRLLPQDQKWAVLFLEKKFHHTQTSSHTFLQIFSR